MDYSNFVYNLNTNNIVKDRLSRNNEFKKFLDSISGEETIRSGPSEHFESIIANCKEPNDYTQFLILLPKPTNHNDFHNHLTILNVLALKIANCYLGNDDIDTYYMLKVKFNEFVDYYSTKFKNAGIKADMYIENIGNICCTLDRLNREITTDYTYYVNPKTLHELCRESFNEGVSFTDDDACNPNNTKTINAHIMDLINETDTDYFIAKIEELYKYLESANGNYNDNVCKIFTTALGRSLDMVINNITGKDELLNTLKRCYVLLDDYNGEEFELNVSALINYMDDVIEAIEEYREGEISPFHEMGLGYIYKIIPSDDAEFEANINEVIEKLNEAASKTDIVSILNESIQDRIDVIKDRRQKDKERKQRIKDKKKEEEEKFFNSTEDAREDLYRQNQYDQYNREESSRNTDQEIKNQNKQDKYELKQQRRQNKLDNKQEKRQNKIDFKQQKRLDKWEQKKSDKELRRQERNEARQRRRDETKIGLNRWKTLELTNSNVRKCTNAIRKCTKAVTVGGAAALAGINPILAGSTYTIRSFAKDPAHHNDTQKLVDDIRNQIIDIDEKISQAESNNELDKKRALMKMRNKLDTTLKKISVTERMEGTV